MQGKRQARHITCHQPFAAMQHQKAGAVAGDIVHRIGQFLEPMLLSRLARGDGCTETTAGHHPGRLGRG